MSKVVVIGGGAAGMAAAIGAAQSGHSVDLYEKNPLLKRIFLFKYMKIYPLFLV